jgi:hypothetical protein
MHTFWTIQHADKWKYFQESGVLIADEKFVPDDFIFAYSWMNKQMRARIKNAPEGNHHYPIWAWYKYDVNRRRPDLRKSGYLEKGAKGVLIEFEASMDDVLLSDFIEWHMVLNASKELKVFNSIIIHPNQQRRIAQSIVQATLWQVKLESVKSALEFKSR